MFKRLFLAVLLTCSLATAAQAQSLTYGGQMLAKVEQLEERLNARIGVAILDTASDRLWSHRGEERFPLASTFKPFACGALLARVDEGAEDLSQMTKIRQSDIITWSPVTKKMVGSMMSREELCEAALTMSDNAAANKVMERVGGPTGVTAFMHRLGDEVTHLDRWEPDLNEALPDDPRDTTSPEAMAGSLQALLLGRTLSEESRKQLLRWMEKTKVSRGMFSKVLPKGWKIAYRSGAGGYGTRNFIALMVPKGEAPVIFTAYMTEASGKIQQHDKAIEALVETMVKGYREGHAGS